MRARLAWLLLVTSTYLNADGGMVLLHKEAAPFVNTVFASPSPPHASTVDMSVLVESSETLEAILDADVQFEFTKSGSQVRVRATRDQSQNKLLYAASVRLEDPGDWSYTVAVRVSSAPIKVTGTMEVAAEQPKLEAYWSYLALPFLCLAIFALHQWLRGRKRDNSAPLITISLIEGLGRSL